MSNAPTGADEQGDDLCDTAIAALILGRSRWTVARLVKTGELRPVQTMGLGHVFRRSDVIAYRDRSTIAANLDGDAA